MADEIENPEGGTDTPAPWHGLTPDVMVDHASGRIPAMDHPVIKDTPDGQTAAMRLINANREISQRVKIPSSDATTEDLNDFYAKMGRPATHEGYDWKPDGEDPAPFVDAMKPVAFESGLTNMQFAKLADGYQKANVVVRIYIVQQGEFLRRPAPLVLGIGPPDALSQAKHGSRPVRVVPEVYVVRTVRLPVLCRGPFQEVLRDPRRARVQAESNHRQVPPEAVT